MAGDLAIGQDDTPAIPFDPVAELGRLDALDEHIALSEHIHGDTSLYELKFE
jgi:hypothetical protein